MHLNAEHPVLYDDPTPLPIDSFAVRQQGHTCFDYANFMLGLGDR